MHFTITASFSNKKRIFIIHNTAYLPFTPKRPTIQGRINRSTLPYPMEAKRENPSAPYGGVLRPFSVRDAFGTQAKVCLHV